MNDQIQEAISILCDELVLQIPQLYGEGRLVLYPDGAAELRIFPIMGGRAIIMLAVIGKAAAMAEARKETIATFLSRCLTLHGVRFTKLSLTEAITLDSGELILWRKFNNPYIALPEFLQAAESILNEAEYWQGNFATA